MTILFFFTGCLMQASPFVEERFKLFVHRTSLDTQARNLISITLVQATSYLTIYNSLLSNFLISVSVIHFPSPQSVFYTSARMSSLKSEINHISPVFKPSKGLPFHSQKLKSSPWLYSVPSGSDSLFLVSACLLIGPPFPLYNLMLRASWFEWPSTWSSCLFRLLILLCLANFIAAKRVSSILLTCWTFSHLRAFAPMFPLPEAVFSELADELISLLNFIFA